MSQRTDALNQQRDAYWKGTTSSASPLSAVPAAGDVPQDVIPAIRQKDHVIAALLALFLGMFGIHKFYLGYYQTAFLMMSVCIVGGLLTFAIAAAVVWVIAIVEGVIYLARTQTDFEWLYVQNRREWF